MDRTYRLTLWLIIICAAVLYLWVNNHPGKSDSQVENAEIENTPDLYITDMDLTRYSIDGIANMHTKADTFSYYEEEGEGLLSWPHVILIDDEIETWKIESRRAVIHDNEDIEFFTDVVAKKMDAVPILIVNSDYIKYSNSTNFISTQTPVEITQGKQVVNAIGMTVNLNQTEPVIDLLTEVTFSYEPS